MNIGGKVQCLFEQSGTFKRAFGMSSEKPAASKASPSPRGVSRFVAAACQKRHPRPRP